MSATTIAAIRATPVTVPLEAPLLHSNGAHWGRFVRTIVEVETDDGYVGLGEMGGGGEDARARFAALADYLRGHDVFRLEAMRFAICNPTASLYNNRTQLHAAIEFACLDIMGQKLGVPVHALLGGKLRDDVEFASYLFFRYNDPTSGRGEVRTAEQLVAHAARAQGAARLSRRTSSKAASIRPRTSSRAIARSPPRFPATASATTRTARCRSPTRSTSAAASSTCATTTSRTPSGACRSSRGSRNSSRCRSRPTRWSSISSSSRRTSSSRAVDVILLDTTFWGGIRPCIKAAGVCETMGVGVAVHSSGELGIQLATMLHLGAVLPNLGYAADAHYHHLADDVIVGGQMPYRERRDPRARRQRARRRARPRQARALPRALSASSGGYPYDRDPGRPGWYPTGPEPRLGDPTVRCAALSAADV